MYRVEGYDFEDKELAEKAEIEAEGIRYIKEHTKFDDPMHVLKLYRQMIQENMFETPVGITFLKELQVYLLSIPTVDKDMIMDIPVSLPLRKGITQEKQDSDKKTTDKKSLDKNQGTRVQTADRDGYMAKYQVARFLAIVFALVIVGMFLITKISTNNVNILNYENQIIDKYEEWEKELEQRELNLKEKEAQLQGN